MKKSKLNVESLHEIQRNANEILDILRADIVGGEVVMFEKPHSMAYQWTVEIKGDR